VRFQVGAHAMGAAPWDNSQVQYLELLAPTIYLPLLRR
jgi:hypothetical protein